MAGRTSYRPFLLHLLAVSLAVSAACRSAAPQAPAPAPHAPSPPATPAPATPATAPSSPAPVPDAIRWVRDSVEHRALFLQVYRSAAEYVEREAATRTPGTWAVVLDADETVIDNSLYQLERAKVGEDFHPESWRAWCARREAVPLPGAQAFLSRVRALGGKIAIVTNRTQTECPDTEAVFAAHGLAYDLMLCKPNQGSSDKNARFEAVMRGTVHAGLPPLELLAFVGDNIRDFPGLGQALRQEDDDAFEPFGARYFVLPNPMYGSWKD